MTKFMKLDFRIGLLFSAAALWSPCAHADAIYTIEPSMVNALPGDVGDTFDVDVTNTGSSTIDVSSFQFEITASSTDVTFTAANFTTTTATYIFDGNSFDQSFPLALNTSTLPAQVLDAADGTANTDDVAIAPGATLGLGQIVFSVSPSAPIEQVTVSFTGGDLENLLANAEGDTYDPDLQSGTIMITPEPATATVVLAGLGLLFVRRRLAPNRQL